MGNLEKEEEFRMQKSEYSRRNLTLNTGFRLLNSFFTNSEYWLLSPEY
jgi:hypothetical protein